MARGKHSFSLQVAAFARKAGDNANLVVRKVVIDLSTRIVMRSPVATGRFRANWQYGNFSGQPVPSGTLDAVDPGGSAALGRITASVPMEAAGMRHVIVNNLPYAQALEDGWSKQAPAGMVGLAATEFQLCINNAVKGVN